MGDLCRLIWCALIGLFRSRAALEAEVLVLRHQLNVLRRKSPKRVALSSIDRLLLVGLYRLAPGVLDALKIVRPETLMCWHRAGFRAYWRWKSRPRGGRPKTAADIRRLIREMTRATDHGCSESTRWCGGRMPVRPGLVTGLQPAGRRARVDARRAQADQATDVADRHLRAAGGCPIEPDRRMATG
jgi:hypothetical protein